jgi:hypothetical protein
MIEARFIKFGEEEPFHIIKAFNDKELIPVVDKKVKELITENIVFGQCYDIVFLEIGSLYFDYNNYK